MKYVREWGRNHATNGKPITMGFKFNLSRADRDLPKRTTSTRKRDIPLLTGNWFGILTTLVLGDSHGHSHVPLTTTEEIPTLRSLPQSSGELEGALFVCLSGSGYGTQILHDCRLLCPWRVLWRFFHLDRHNYLPYSLYTRNKMSRKTEKRIKCSVCTRSHQGNSKNICVSLSLLHRKSPNKHFSIFYLHISLWKIPAPVLMKLN